MFKKLYKTLEEIKSLIRSLRQDHDAMYNEMRSNFNIIDNRASVKKSLERIIVSQQQTIELLTNALQHKYENGLFIFSDDGTNFRVIQNGEEIANDRLAYCRVTWAPGEAVTLETEYMI